MRSGLKRPRDEVENKNKQQYKKKQEPNSI